MGADFLFINRKGIIFKKKRVWQIGNTKYGVFVSDQGLQFRRHGVVISAMASRDNVVIVVVRLGETDKLFQFSGLSWSQLVDMFHLKKKQNREQIGEANMTSILRRRRRIPLGYSSLARLTSP